jgi:hypothetical protein
MLYGSAPDASLLDLQVWICMHYILWRIKKLEGLAGATDDDADLLRQNARASPCCYLSLPSAVACL